MMLTASTQVSYAMRANFLGGQNKELIITGDANPPQILKLWDAERCFVPKIEFLACNGCNKPANCPGHSKAVSIAISVPIRSGRFMNYFPQNLYLFFTLLLDKNLPLKI